MQRSIIIGTLLGDGSLIETFSKKNLRLQIDHCDAQKAYVQWKYEQLKSLILTPPTYQVKNRSWRFRTISHPELTEIGRLFYRNRQKVVPQGLEQLLTPLGLAIWFMDDGAAHPTGALINTQSFKKDECEYLQKILKQSFSITHTNLHKDHNGWRLYIGARSRQRFIQIVQPFLLPCMMYKLEDPVETTRRPQPQFS